VLSIVIGAPVGLRIIRKIEKQYTPLLNLCKPILQRIHPVIHMFEAVTRKNIVYLLVGQ
jgi:hypothetical protein